MKICFLANSFLLDSSTQVTGTHVQLFNLAEAFSQRGLDVHYLSLTRTDKDDQETLNGIKVHWVRSDFAFLSVIREFFILSRNLDNISADVIYQRGRGHLTYVASHWAKTHKRVFVWGSNGEDSCDFWKNLGLLRRSSRPIWKKVFLFPYFAVIDTLIHRGIRDASCVNQTEHQKAQLMKNYGKSGVAIPSYFKLPASTNTDKKEKICLWIANLNPTKQPELFLKFAEYCRDLKEWQFWLVGGTKNKQYSNVLAEKAKTISNVRLVGAVPFIESEHFFKRASLYVNTSLHEADGIPNAMIQALLNDVPVLSLNHDPNNWITNNDIGLFTHGNIEKFLNYGHEILRDEAHISEKRARCRDFAEKTFASPQIIDSYLNIFKALIA